MVRNTCFAEPVLTDPLLMVRNAQKIERVLIAYDGSGYSRAALSELQHSGLPQKAEVIIISVSEIWLPVRYEDSEIVRDLDISEYYEQHSAQTNRGLAETKSILFAAREELLRYFPNWDINTEAVRGSPATEILSRASVFRPDLIVVGPQGLSSDRETGLGSISHTILATSKDFQEYSRHVFPATEREPKAPKPRIGARNFAAQ